MDGAPKTLLISCWFYYLTIGIPWQKKKNAWFTHGWTVVVRYHFTNLWLSIFKAWFWQSLTWSTIVEPWYDHGWPWLIMHHGCHINVQKSHEIGQWRMSSWIIVCLSFLKISIRNTWLFLLDHITWIGDHAMLNITKIINLRLHCKKQNLNAI